MSDEKRLDGADRHEFHSDNELIQRWLRSQQRALGGGTGIELWAKVRDQFSIGSTSAKSVCVRHGFDPDLRVRKRRYV